ncbi:hypothetical protein ACNO8X_22920 [Mycobacterium sp. PDNC021]|uniref:hypothetical protein n=1 Tax=Mycobacterium sp. PDNC021 TaxID=3391399 RepID=UPI003AAA4BAC
MTESAKNIVRIAAAVIAAPIVLAYPYAAVPLVVAAVVVICRERHDRLAAQVIDEVAVAREVAQLTDQNLAWALRSWSRNEAR